MHRTKIHELLRSLGNRIFHISWITKDGNVRTANARRYVKKNLKGTGRRINQPGNSYIPIFLMHNLQGDTAWDNTTGWRTLNLDTVLSVKCKGHEYQVKPEPILDSINLSETTQPVKDNVLEFRKAS